MKQRRIRISIHLIVIFILVIVSKAYSDTSRYYIEMSGGYKGGDFGTSARTHLINISPTLGYVSSWYDISTTSSYLVLVASENNEILSTNGIGDTIVRSSLSFRFGEDEDYSINPSAAVKLPTASESKGLGTGEFDFGGFVNFAKSFDENKIAAMLGVIKITDSASQNYNDLYVYGISFSRTFFYTTNVYTSFEVRKALIEGITDPKEISIGFFHLLNYDYALKGSTFLGLNDSGPGFGIQCGIVRWF